MCVCVCLLETSNILNMLIKKPLSFLIELLPHNYFIIKSCKADNTNIHLDVMMSSMQII